MLGDSNVQIVENISVWVESMTLELAERDKKRLIETLFYMHYLDLPETALVSQLLDNPKFFLEQLEVKARQNNYFQERFKLPNKSFGLFRFAKKILGSIQYEEIGIAKSSLDWLEPFGFVNLNNEYWMSKSIQPYVHIKGRNETIKTKHVVLLVKHQDLAKLQQSKDGPVLTGGYLFKIPSVRLLDAGEIAKIVKSGSDLDWLINGEETTNFAKEIVKYPAAAFVADYE